MGRDKARMAVYSMAGIYLEYLAYTMYGSLSNSKGSEHTLMIVFMVFFVVVGAGMIGLGIHSMWKNAKELKEQQEKAALEGDVEEEDSTESVKENETEDVEESSNADVEAEEKED